MWEEEPVDWFSGQWEVVFYSQNHSVWLWEPLHVTKTSKKLRWVNFEDNQMFNNIFDPARAELNVEPNHWFNILHITFRLHPYDLTVIRGWCRSPASDHCSRLSFNISKSETTGSFRRWAVSTPVAATPQDTTQDHFYPRFVMTRTDIKHDLFLNLTKCFCA